MGQYELKYRRQTVQGKIVHLVSQNITAVHIQMRFIQMHTEKACVWSFLCRLCNTERELIMK